ncbi:MAG: hypothetical protein F4081_02135 [Dehalococcoidia bacterium]|nr:hypothetical protein [Dehalococcoidia bacterium]MYI85598.1 hypothetical protein [Dehalococcoidia bacterium]
MSGVMFVVNVEKGAARALVHRADCRFFQGRIPKAASDGGWTGLWQNRDDAFRFAMGSGMAVVDEAECCRR